MSYRKKHYPAKAKHFEPQELLGKEYINPGEARVLSTGRLTSGLSYQQPLSEKKVDRLVKEWDDRLLTPLIVSFRDGKYFVVDGQHRVAAMRRMNDGKEVFVPCLVYDGLTYEQEAALCYRIDRTKGRLSLAMSTNALMESGEDAQVLEIRSLLEQAGFTWALKKRSAGTEYEITATRAVINAYQLLGGAAFSRMLGLMADAWHGTPSSLSASILSGMALFFKTYETEIDDRTFIRQMSGVDPEEIIWRGKVDFSTNRAALRFARVIWDKYNGHQRGGRKLPYRFEG